MSPVVGAAFLPHPPILLPAIGKGEEQKASITGTGYEKVMEEIKAVKPQVILLLTPHGSSDTSLVTINQADKLQGNFSGFGFPDISLQFVNHFKMAEELVAFGRTKNLSLSSDSCRLDHGALVPLYFIQQSGIQLPLIHISVGWSELDRAFALGRELFVFCERQQEKVIVVVSGDLSHRLATDGPYGFHPAGPRFDQQVRDAFVNNSLKDLVNMNKDMIYDAGQCGLLSFVIAAGMMSGKKAFTRLHSYEGPYGVGYLCAFAGFLENSGHHGAVKLATEAIRRYVEKKERLNFNNFSLEHPEETFLEEALTTKAGAFVSIHLGGNLRGCIGTVESVYEHVGIEIINNAIEAACRDPRFDPVETHELDDLEIKVDVLSPMEKVDSITDLDVQKYGVMVESGYRRGLLLPALEGINSVGQQLAIACRKAGIDTKEDYQIYRFSVNRYE